MEQPMIQDNFAHLTSNTPRTNKRTLAGRVGLIAVACSLGLSLASPATLAHGRCKPDTHRGRDKHDKHDKAGKKDFSSKRLCQDGRPQCVNHVVSGMSQALRKLAKSCDHNSIFALAYLRTTETYGETLDSIEYEDPSSVTREDALFADYYFDAYEAYQAGDDDVPQAWQIAFDAAEARSMTSSGNALLGFNAHIQRDLPYTLYELYLDGHEVSRHDHEKVNEFLVQVEFSQEIIDRFDPTYPLGGDPSLIFYWRQLAYENFLALRDAPDEDAFDAAVAQIEAVATQTALGIVQTLSYPPGVDSSERDAYCDENGFPG